MAHWPSAENFIEQRSVRTTPLGVERSETVERLEQPFGSSGE
jgi:hypothetical protein